MVVLNGQCLIVFIEQGKLGTLPHSVTMRVGTKFLLAFCSRSFLALKLRPLLPPYLVEGWGSILMAFFDPQLQWGELR